MFLQATFFTTAGNRSEAFFPRAIIWIEQGRRGRNHGTDEKETTDAKVSPSMDFRSLPAHRHNPLHGLQLEGILVGVQHLLQVIMPGEMHRGH